MVRVGIRESRALAQTYARAGLIASEFTLTGSAAATFLVAGLLVFLPDVSAPLLRPGLAAASGLYACGVAVSVVGRWLDVGGSRRSALLSRLWWPLLWLGLAGAGSGALTLHQAGLIREGGEHLLWPQSLLVLLALGAILAVAVLATLGLRGLAAVTGGAPLPFVQLWQAATHGLTAGLGLMALIGFASDALPKPLQVYLATAVSVMAGHAALAATLLLHRSRRAISGLRAAGLASPVLERGHWMASTALVAGLVLPGLLVVAHLLVNRELPLIPACAVAAMSNHAMRYGLVLIQPHAPLAPAP